MKVHESEMQAGDVFEVGEGGPRWLVRCDGKQVHIGDARGLVRREFADVAEVSDHEREVIGRMSLEAGAQEEQIDAILAAANTLTEAASDMHSTRERAMRAKTREAHQLLDDAGIGLSTSLLIARLSLVIERMKKAEALAEELDRENAKLIVQAHEQLDQARVPGVGNGTIVERVAQLVEIAKASASLKEDVETKQRIIDLKNAEINRCADLLRETRKVLAKLPGYDPFITLPTAVKDVCERLRTTGPTVHMEQNEKCHELLTAANVGTADFLSGRLKKYMTVMNNTVEGLRRERNEAQNRLDNVLTALGQ
jgi:hypothetical protein